MVDQEIYSEEFIPVLRKPGGYCEPAEELVKAAEALERNPGLATDPLTASQLTDWLFYKAGLLDRDFQAWENRYREEETTVRANKATEKAYAYALAVAREVNFRDVRDAESESEGREV